MAKKMKRKSARRGLGSSSAAHVAEMHMRMSDLDYDASGAQSAAEAGRCEIAFGMLRAAHEDAGSWRAHVGATGIPQHQANVKFDSPPRSLVNADIAFQRHCMRKPKKFR